MLKKLVIRAKKKPKTIIFPEGNDKRILLAVKKAIQTKIAFPLLIGDERKIIKKLGKPRKYGIIKRDTHEKHLLKKLLEARKGKLTPQKAKQLLKKDSYFAVMCVKEGLADGLVGGATMPTKDILLPAFQIIGTHKKRKASGAFLMITKEGKEYLFSDCAANINPDWKTLVDIAEKSVETARFLGIKPKVAMLSFSTKGSAHSPEVDKVRKAVKALQRKHPRLAIDGEIQADAAIVPSIAKRKCAGKKCKLKGDANVLVFPCLNSANIGHKLVERLGGGHAIGPIIQGLKMPVNDLSRGASVDDIFYLTALTVVQAQGGNK